MTRAKSHKEPEFARWKYKVKIDVEETRSKAQNLGFSCRTFEGQPKNKRGKDGWGEHYPLPQCEIAGGDFPPNSKIHISPSMSQIFFFGSELVNPSHTNLDELQSFLERIEILAGDLEKSEKIMNGLAVFAAEEEGRFGQPARINANVPAMFRLIMSLKDVSQQLFDNIIKKFSDECIKASDEMLQGKIFLASKRIDDLLKEAVFFQRNLIDTARALKDPRAEQWEADLNRSLIYPLGFANYGLRKTQPEDKK